MGTAAGRWVLLATVLGSGLVMIDGTVVNVALPHIGADLGAGFGGLQWVVNAYTLTLASLILLGGSLGDQFGRRRVIPSVSSGSRSHRSHADSRPTSRS